MSNNKDAYYFSHDANALTDPKILAMRCDYGLEGYGLYWAIIEMMRNEETYRLNYSKNTFRAIKSLTNTTIEIEKYINDCINDYELFKVEDNKLFSNSLLRRMEDYDHKKTISRENGKKGGAPKGNQNAKKTKENNLKTTQNNQQVDLIQAETTQNNQSKVKKSKENESKENNSRSCNEPINFDTENLNDIIDFYNNNIGLITPYTLEILSDYAKDMDNDVIIYAMKRAVESNARNINFIKTVLNNWYKSGVKTLIQAQEENQHFKNKNKPIEETEEEKRARKLKELEEATKDDPK